MGRSLLLLQGGIDLFEWDLADIKGRGPAVFLFPVNEPVDFFCPSPSQFLHFRSGPEKERALLAKPFPAGFDTRRGLAFLEAVMAEIALVHDPPAGRKGLHLHI